MMPRFIRNSLRNKVMVMAIATTLVALLLSALGLVIYDLRAYERQWSTDLEAQADVLARASAPALSFGDRVTAEKDLSVMRVRQHILAAALYTPDGKLFATYVKKNAEVPAFPPAPGADGYRIAGDELVLFRSVVENGEKIGTVHLRSTYRPWDRLRDYLTILLGVMVASLAVAAVVASWMQKAVIGPILEVSGLAHRVRETRDYSLRATKTTEDETGQLVDSFNEMLAESGRRAAAIRLADQRKDEFLATLAHELRNPLAPIRNGLEILRVAGDDPDKALMAREMMQRQLTQMVRLVDDLLDVSRITTGKLAVRKEALELQSVLRDAVEIVRPFLEARRHKFDCVLPDEPIVVDGDRTRLAQVFSNLLNNAAKYTDPGGQILLSAAREGEDAVVRVRDNGVGLAPESLEQIFDMFVQVDRTLERSQAGLGVGLTLARRLVQLHEGSIEAHSDGAGRGSEFVVRLPLTFVRMADSPGTVEPARSGAGRRVLLADDNVDFATSLGDLLSARGHEVRIAHDGAEALRAAEAFRPEVAFVDIGMPKVHGYEVARRMRASPGTARTLLVAVTGWGQENDRKRAREAGFDRHLVKPVDPGEIEAILEGR
ncbi:MAG TPA: ATP-binding protein [Usitatibacter sp.]|nr:ATP-binding protein [Usitatibacter sp.]